MMAFRRLAWQKDLFVVQGKCRRHPDQQKNHGQNDRSFKIDLFGPAKFEGGAVRHDGVKLREPESRAELTAKGTGPLRCHQSHQRRLFH